MGLCAALTPGFALYHGQCIPSCTPQSRVSAAFSGVHLSIHLHPDGFLS